MAEPTHPDVAEALEALRVAAGQKSAGKDELSAALFLLCHALGFSAAILRFGSLPNAMIERTWRSDRSAPMLDAGKLDSLDDLEGIVGSWPLEEGRAVLARTLGPCGVRAAAFAMSAESISGAAHDAFFLGLTHFAAAAEMHFGKRGAGPLTARELSVVDLAARGFNANAISECLGIAEATVKFRLASIRKKLSARNKTEAVARAAALGLVSLHQHRCSEKRRTGRI